jgi:MFS family permease
VDAASYLWSGLWLRTIRATEQVPPRPARRHLPREIGAGLRLVRGHPILRAIAAHNASLSLFQSAETAIVVVFLVREVHLSAWVIGVLSSVGLLGALVASALTRVVSDRIGTARLLWLAGVIGGVGFLLTPLTTQGRRLVFGAGGTFLASIAIIVLNIVEASFEQSVCPPALLGRLNATMRFTTWGVMPLGSVLGGVAGAQFGLRTTLWITGVGALVAAAWLVCSPVRTLRDLPVTAEATAMRDTARP